MLEKYRQRATTRRALNILQNISINCSDDDGSSDTEIDPVVNATVASAQVVESAETDDSITEASNSDDEPDGEVTH